MKQAILFFSTFLFVSSCKLEDMKDNVTVSGLILNKADSTPWAHTTFNITQTAYSGNDKDFLRVSFTTDDSGRINFATQLYSGTAMFICWPFQDPMEGQGDFIAGNADSVADKNGQLRLGTIYAQEP